MILAGWLVTGSVALAAPGAAEVARVRAQSEPCHPLLAAWLDQEGATPRGSGGRRTQTATAFPIGDGRWATAGHAVTGTASVVLEVDGTPGTAQVIARSFVHDLALLQAEPDVAHPATRPPTAAPTTGPDGPPLTATGFPGDGVQTTLVGTQARPHPATLPGYPPGAYHRIDLAVRRGLSGAPVLQDGHRVGMVVAGSTPDSALAGDGLMMPEPALSEALAALARREGHRFAGLTVDPTPQGARVRAVAPHSLAARAGLRPGDLLAGLGDARGARFSDLRVLADAILTDAGPWEVWRGDVTSLAVPWPPQD